MRDGPPVDEATMSSQTLLHEIAILRTRLRDLEEDGRSSICESFVEGDAAMVLKKEVVKLADEKAKQEKEFMNQMSSLAIENQSIIADLKSKLARSRASQEELEDRVEALTSAHATEIERLTENLTRADEEIAEARQEIDYLQQENEDFRSEKTDIYKENEALRLELENERRRTDSYRVQHKKSEEKVEKLCNDVSAKDKMIEELREQIGEMNDSMVELENAKEKAKNQLEMVREELGHAKQKLQNERNKSIDHSIFSAERENLERSCEQLEERLQRSQARLAEKDATIESLTNSLKEERISCRKMRKELKEERENGPDSKEETCSGHGRTVNGINSSNKEIEFLRRRNKSLNDEVRELRKKVNGVDNAAGENLRESQTENSKSGVALNPISSPPRSRKSTSASISPRTAVSGLVASFESRIHRRGDEKREDNGNSSSSDFSPSADKTVDLGEARRTIQYFETELQEEREKVANLHKQLSRAHADNETVNSLARKLEQSLGQVESLQRKVEALEKEKKQYSGEIEQLQYDASIAKEIAALQEEKKEEEREEELTRLRSQVGALQSELNNAMEQVDELNGEISKLQISLSQEKRRTEETIDTMEGLRAQAEAAKTQGTTNETIQKKHNAEINKLQVDLTNTQLAKADLQAELSIRIKELETEFEAMEIVANEEIDELKSQLSSLKQIMSGKDEQINRLETEKNQLCNNMSMASNAKNDEFEELQSELIDKTAKNTAQAREIQVLKMKVEEFESLKRGKAEWLQSRVSELENELENLKAIHKKSGSWEDIERLRRENIQLKETAREMKMERRNLQDRIEALVSERSSSKSVHILRERNAALKEEVEKLTRRLKKMEESITRFAI